MDGDNQNDSFLTSAPSVVRIPKNNNNNDLTGLMMMTGTIMPPPQLDDNEADVLNDETFGDCDLETIKIKSDFGENGEFLGDEHPLSNNNNTQLPSFFDMDMPDMGGISLNDDDDDQSQQPSIDALLGEDPLRLSSISVNRRPPPPTHPTSNQTTPLNPLFNMAISQATENHNNAHLFHQHVPQQQQQQQPISRIPPAAVPPSQQQMAYQYQILKQFEQMLIQRQVPPQERLVYIQAMMEKMQRDTLNVQQQAQLQQQQQQAARAMNLNINGHDRYRETNPSRVLNNPHLFAQRQQQQQREAAMRSMAIGEMMERARLAAVNAHSNNNSRPQSPAVGSSSSTGLSSQFIDAIQRSDQIPIVADSHHPQQQQQHRAALSPSASSPLDSIVSPSSRQQHGHHIGQQQQQSRQNRPARHYPRPPCLNTWQGRGPGHDEFAGMMTDREKQWVVKIQLHQVSQTKEEDYYFHKWSQQKRHMQQVHGNQQQQQQTNRHDHRGQQYISFPVLQLLKSIQQEKELAQRLSQASSQASFSNVNPSSYTLQYASPTPTQLGKQSTATPRHPKCILHLDGHFSLGTRANAITHDKYTLGLLLNIENLHRDILRLDDDDELPSTPAKNPTETTTNEPESATATPQSSSATIPVSTQLLDSIVDRYLCHPDYLFADIFGQFSKGQILLERLYPYIMTAADSSTSIHVELMLVRLYGSLSYMVRRWPTTFHVESIVMNMISLMQQQVNVKKTTFEQLLAQTYTYYEEEIKPKLMAINSAASLSPFSDPVLFTNSYTVTILIELLLTLERRCYLLPGINSSALPIQLMQQLQPQLQYQLSEHVRLLVGDLCQALVACAPPAHLPKKMLKPFAQVQQQQFGLLCKFLRVQTPQHVYAALEPRLIYCCIKDS